MWERNVLIALFVIVVLLVAISRYKGGAQLEAFKSGDTPKDIASKIASEVSTLQDKLNIASYRSSYEDMLMQSDEWANLTLLDLMLSSDGSNKGMMRMARDFNDLCQFKTNLNVAMAFVDKN
jgi:hypothetical protein